MGGAVQSVVSGVSNAVSDVGKGVSDILGSDVGKAAATAAALYYGAPLAADALGTTAATTGAVATPVTSGSVLATELPAFEYRYGL